MDRCHWINGWGVDAAYLAHIAKQFLPNAKHRVWPPTVDAVTNVSLKEGTIVAWSLGALRMLDAAAAGLTFKGTVVLLAPFVAFCEEYGFGGKSTITQVRWLRRWIQRDPSAGLSDFYDRSGLGQMRAPCDFNLRELLDGLERLEADAPLELRRFVLRGLPAGWSALIGNSDPFFDAAKVAASIPGCQIVPGAGHGVAELVSSAALKDRKDLHAI